MTAIINRDKTPGHLFNIPQLDFSNDLFAERLAGPWFRLGAWTVAHPRDERNVEEEVFRQSLLLSLQAFAQIFAKLESIGNVIGHLGKPGGSVLNTGVSKEYHYSPFHQFVFPFTRIVGEPLVFVHSDTSNVHLFINPDLWLFLELEEKSPGSGIWWDPRRGVDVLQRRVIDHGNLKVVEIRTEYLLEYLRARQMSLIVGHYHQLLFFDPTQESVESFVKEDLTLGSPDQGAKAILQNWGLRQDVPGRRFLQRRLHLWFEIKPPELDINDPWSEQASFDLYTFTLPTRSGPVAPARWISHQDHEGQAYEGNVCDFMDRIYFRQEVLTKYEGASGFDVKDDGSVSCYHWGLSRSTSRVGNELLSTAIGDFAEGVPFEEWAHWKQYAVEPPSRETLQAIRQEETVPDTVNSLVSALHALNSFFAELAVSLTTTVEKPLWSGSLDSLAGRQLKWVYPATADDDEFLKRATLASTLVIEAIESAALRKLLRAMGSNLDMNYENPPRSLGPRNLLQRLTLITVLIEKLGPKMAELPTLIMQAEGKARNAEQPDLQEELEGYARQVRGGFSPLAFLYDLRSYGGLAHAPNKDRVAKAATQLGLPDKNWHRKDYLRLLELIISSVRDISHHMRKAIEVMWQTY